MYNANTITSNGYKEYWENVRTTGNKVIATGQKQNSYSKSYEVVEQSIKKVTKKQNK